MKQIFGLLLILIGVVLGFWLGGWVFFVGGIIQLIQSITPVVIASGIAVGLLKIFTASLVGGLAFFVFAVTGVALIQE